MREGDELARQQRAEDAQYHKLESTGGGRCTATNAITALASPVSAPDPTQWCIGYL